MFQSAKGVWTALGFFGLSFALLALLYHMPLEQMRFCLKGNMVFGVASLYSLQLEAELAVICLLGVDVVQGLLAWLGYSWL